MKFKTTKKAINEGYYQIISVGSCDLQYLLKGNNPVAYSTRAEGWACDYYDIDGVCICEGYSPIASKNTNKLSYDKIKEYETRAKEISSNYGGWEDVKNALNDLLKEFITECTQKEAKV
jgi:hypothetical protein